MDIDLVVTWQEAERVDVSGRVAVVIDVLRASSTIVGALASGADRVLTVATVEEAREQAAKLGGDRAVLGGERDAVKLPGFDLGNSPREYTPGVVDGKTVILTTTNGTQAVHAAKQAQAIIVAGLVNADAVVRWLIARDLDVTLICSGTEGRLSIDDLHCAGLLLSRLLEPGFIPELKDGVRLAIQWYTANAGSALHVLQTCYHGQRLIERGFDADVAWCSAIDMFDTVPEWDGEGFVPSRLVSG